MNPNEIDSQAAMLVEMTYEAQRLRKEEQKPGLGTSLFAKAAGALAGGVISAELMTSQRTLKPVKRIIPIGSPEKTFFGRHNGVGLLIMATSVGLGAKFGDDIVSFVSNLPGKIQNHIEARKIDKRVEAVLQLDERLNTSYHRQLATHQALGRSA